MLELADRLLARLDAGRRVAVATVVAVTGSSPSVVGTSMAVDDAGDVVGSIAGGCVEGAVVEMCAEVLGGVAVRVEEFGVSDDDAVAVGLTCGGLLRLHAREVSADDLSALRDAAAGREAVLVTRFGDGPDDVLVERAAPPPRLVVYGALEWGAALAAVARAAGWHVTVCDPRPVLATPERLPGAHDVVVVWPTHHLPTLALGGRDAVCVLGHDDRYDAPLVLGALRSGAGYVGAMGSRRTHARRVAALRDLGADDDELARLRSPIGLDLGASTPAETAVAVLAEVLAVRTGGTGRPLGALEGPIHGGVRPAERLAQPARSSSSFS